MPTPNYQEAIAYALRRLDEEIPCGLPYHNRFHTEHDVMPAVVRLAERCQLDEEQTRLLEVAAAFHDIGFIETYEGHELAGVRILSEVLPGFGFSPAQIDRLAGLILSTRLPQSPAGLVEEIMADADLDVLGRPDFLERSEDLRREISGRGGPVHPRAWLEQQLRFLQGHAYFTEAARTLRGPGKAANIARIQAELDRNSFRQTEE